MYYVYELQYPDTLIPFYVGKGKDRRAKYHTMRNKKGFYTDNRYKDNVIRQILLTGVDPVISYVLYTENEDVAYDYEELLIRKYGRRLVDETGILTNICDSARPPRAIYTAERKEKYRQNMLGNTFNTGRIHTQQEKDKRSASLKDAYDSGRRIVSDKIRETSSRVHKNKIVGIETRKKIAIAVQNRPPLSAESIKKGIQTKLDNNCLPPNRKSITINGEVYSSIREASIALNTTEYKVKKLADN